MTEQLEAVTIGEAMWLFVAEPGVVLRRAGSFRAAVAGAESNVAIGLARLGHRVRWQGRLGDDAAGAAVLAELRAERVDVAAVPLDPSRGTGLLVRDSHPARPIEVGYWRAGSAGSALTPQDVRAAGVTGARLLHVTGITAMLSDMAAAAVHEAFELADAAGVPVSFDPNVRLKLGAAPRWAEVVAPLLSRAALVFAGSDELELLTGRSVEAATAQLLAGRAEAVVVKHPDKSATVTTVAGQWREPSRARHVVDPVGAGDALTAGYLSGWLGGRPAAEALRSGVGAAAFVVGSVTDNGGAPTGSELAQSLDGGADGGADVRR